MKDRIQELIDEARANLQLLEEGNVKPWNPSQRNNDENFTPSIEKMRQYYFGMIQGLELAIQEIEK